MARIIYEGDGGVAAIVVPAPNSGMTIEEIAAKDVPAGKVFHIVDDSVIWEDRTFRNAWEVDHAGSGTLRVNMVKARNLWRDKLRAERAGRLVELDGLYLKALEESNAAELLRIAQLKQALRDAPADPRIEAAQTPEDLKLITLPG